MSFMRCGRMPTSKVQPVQRATLPQNNPTDPCTVQLDSDDTAVGHTAKIPAEVSVHLNATDLHTRPEESFTQVRYSRCSTIRVL